MVAKHVNKKYAGKPLACEQAFGRAGQRACSQASKPRVLAIDALQHSLVALAATFSAVAFYCFL